MSKIFHITALLFAVAALGSCGGGGSRQVSVSWDANRDMIVNQAGGGYILYYSQTNGFNINDAQKANIPYVSGATAAPTSATLSLAEGTLYFRVSAYGVWKGAADGSQPSDQLTVNVGG